MEFPNVWVKHGPNVWGRFPVLEVELDLAGQKSLAAAAGPAFRERLLAALPTLAGHTPDATPNGDRPSSLGAALARALQEVTLELQILAGSPVKFGKVRETRRENFFRVGIEHEEEELGLACLEAARELCLAALEGRAYDVPAKLAELRELAYDVRLGPSTAAIVRAARGRNIPVRRLNRGSLVQLGHGCRQRRVCTAETDRTGAIAETIAQDKELTRFLLESIGVPVPRGRPVADAEDAWRAAEELGPPVVVKPQFGNHGRGVATNLTTREQVVQAYAAAREEDRHVIVERFAPGADHRLLVIGGRLVAAALREPAHVVGDGRSTVAELVAEVNKDPRRSDGHATVLSFIKLDAVGLAVLAEQGYTPASVPPPGVRVLIRRNGNLSTGGTAADVTDRVHPEVAARAVEAAAVVGLDIAGVDVVATDIGRPLEAQGAAVVEVNAGPGLRMHLEPSAGKPRPVGEAVVAMLYPDGQDGRIPVVAVTGVNGKTTTTRLIAHLLRRPGECVGMTCTDGTYIDGRRTEKRDCAGPRSAGRVLLNPQVTAAVLETARGGILQAGLGFDRCDVAVVTNVGRGDHLSLHGVETVEELARVKRVVVEAVAPGGTAVLNAGDPLVVAMAPYCPGSVAYFAREGDHPVLAAHRAAGGRAAFVRDGSVVLAEGDGEEEVIALDRVPMTHGGTIAFQVENVLAAAAAARWLGVGTDHIRAGLETFAGDAAQVPGRFNVIPANGGTLVIDYAHNATALEALVRALDRFPHRRRSLVFTGSVAYRRDIDIRGMGEVVGNGFDRVILYREPAKGGEGDPASAALFRGALAAGKRVAETVETRGELEAVGLALDGLGPGELVVIGIESIDQVLAFIHGRLGQGGNGQPAGRGIPDGSAVGDGCPDQMV